MKVTRVMELEEIISSTRDELESLRAKATAPSTSKLDGQPHAAQMSSRVEKLADVPEKNTCAKLRRLRIGGGNFRRELTKNFSAPPTL